MVMDINQFKKAINRLEKIRKGKVDLANITEGTLYGFLEGFNLLDPKNLLSLAEPGEQAENKN